MTVIGAAIEILEIRDHDSGRGLISSTLLDLSLQIFLASPILLLPSISGPSKTFFSKTIFKGGNSPAWSKNQARSTM
jgi:hypothetical protein